VDSSLPAADSPLKESARSGPRINLEFSSENAKNCDGKGPANVK
jgi:hypothetical protein